MDKSITGSQASGAHHIAVRVPSVFGKYFRLLMVFIVYGAIFLEIARYALSIEADMSLLWIILFAQAVRLLFYPRVGALTTLLSITYYTLFFFPATGLMIFDNIYPLQSVCAFIIAFDILRTFGKSNRKPGSAKNVRPRKGHMYLFFALQAWMVLSPFALQSGLVTLVAPLSISAVVLELMLKAGSGKKLLISALLSYGLVFILYILLHWSGFGRLVVGSYIIYIFIVIMHYHDIRFRVWIVPVLLPIALYFAQLSRYGAVDDIRTLLVGSAGHHMMVTEDAIKCAQVGCSLGVGAFWDQFQLFFLGWFPRALWSDKPIGLGLTAVDELYGRSGVGASHTISLGFLGEQYLLLGQFAFLGLALMLVIILLARKMIDRYSRGLIAPVAAFDVSLISFFWGSMGTFGDRVWFLVIPGLIFLFILRLRVK